MYDEDPPYRPVAVNKQGEPEDTDDDNTKAYKQKDFVVGRDCLRRASTYHSLMREFVPRILYSADLSVISRTDFEWNLWRQVCEIVDTVKAEQETSDDEEEGNLTRCFLFRCPALGTTLMKSSTGKSGEDSRGVSLHKSKRPWEKWV